MSDKTQTPEPKLVGRKVVTLRGNPLTVTSWDDGSKMLSLRPICGGFSIDIHTDPEELQALADAILERWPKLKETIRLDKCPKPETI